MLGLKEQIKLTPAYADGGGGSVLLHMSVLLVVTSITKSVSEKPTPPG